MTPSATSFRGLFISATGTDAGKTVISRGICAAIRNRGHAVAAIKPIETGCTPDPLDATALADACGRPALANAPGLYRVPPPLAPYAATRAGMRPPPDPDALAATVRSLATPGDFLLVEGAGGLRVPLDPTRDMTHLAAALRLPVVLVAPDALGVLSHVLCAVDTARCTGLDLSAVILNRLTPQADSSAGDNRGILAERLAHHGVPVLAMPYLPHPSQAAMLAATAQADWSSWLGHLLRPC